MRANLALMRVVAVEVTDHAAHGLRAAYHWSEAPATPPRLLIEAPRDALASLRHTLETVHFGEPMRTGEFQVVTLADAFTDAVRAAFAGLDVTALDRATAEQAAYWLLESAPPDQRVVLTLAYLPGTPTSFDRLCDWLTATLSALPDEAYSALDQIYQGLHFALAGRSMYALTEAYQSLYGVRLKLPAVPTRSTLHTSDQPVRHTVMDLRVPVHLDPLSDAALLVLVVASDPGLGHADLELLSRSPDPVVALIDTHHDPQHLAAMTRYIQEQIGATPLITDRAQLASRINLMLTDKIRAALLSWLDTWPPDHERARRVIERFSL